MMPCELAGVTKIRSSRPLGAFSDFVCDSLGMWNELVRQGMVSADELFNTAHDLLSAVSDRTYDQLRLSADVTSRRIAILDLVWMVRSLDVAYAEDGAYLARKNGSALLRVTRMLADVEQRNPNLSWSDIAMYHPVADPRCFLAPGPARDEEIFMYRSQHAIEKILKLLVELHERDELALDILPILPVSLDSVVQTMVRLSVDRTPGHFYALDSFLGPNHEFVGHATGAFSAWSYIVGYFLFGHDDFKQRLLRPQNRRAFDCDAHPYIQRIENGTFSTADNLLRTCELDDEKRDRANALFEAARKNFTLFLRVHRGAITRHAHASFDDAAPADLAIANRESVHRGIAGAA